MELLSQRTLGRLPVALEHPNRSAAHALHPPSPAPVTATQSLPPPPRPLSISSWTVNEHLRPEKHTSELRGPQLHRCCSPVLSYSGAENFSVIPTVSVSRPRLTYQPSWQLTPQSPLGVQSLPDSAGLHDSAGLLDSTPRGRELRENVRSQCHPVMGPAGSAQAL